MSVGRRTVVRGLAGLGLSATVGGAVAPTSSRMPSAALSPTGRVVVVGGGMGGTTAAKYLRMWGGSGLQVTLVAPSTAYTSNILSNLVLTGQRNLGSLAYSYGALSTAYGVSVRTASATSIDTTNRRVALSTGATLPYDRLLLAPGVSFDALPGLTTADYASRFPHAWQAGPQTTMLRNQIVGMRAGGTVVITIPAAPYRCPPGPYERACLIAAWLRRHRPGSKVIVLDANPRIMAEPRTFGYAFTVIHKGYIRYVPGAVVRRVDRATKTVHTSAGAFRGDVLNLIPPHRAAPIAQRAGLVNVAGRWAGVNVLTYESTATPRVHVIGDATGTTMPKSGHMANAQAKIAAEAIVRLMSGRAPYPSPATSSACYSPVTLSTASWLTAVYQYDAASRTMKTRSIGEGGISSESFEAMGGWFTTLMRDSFR